MSEYSMNLEEKSNKVKELKEALIQEGLASSEKLKDQEKVYLCARIILTLTNNEILSLLGIYLNNMLRHQN